jgi:Ca-activated chloride channel family protein
MYLSRLSRAYVCALILSAVSAVVSAQEPPPATQTAAASPARVEVMLTGGRGHAAPELKREDLRIYVDNIERPVVSLEKEVLPVSYGLVVDNSGSLRSQANAVVAAAKYLVGQNAPEDEAFVERFVSSDNIQNLQTLTADKAALNSALDSMRIQPGQTALLDALYLAGDYLTKSAGGAGAPTRGRALILVTDGEDRLSSHKAEEVLKLLKDGGVQVFCVGLTGELEDNGGLIGKGKREKARDLLSKLADETGGRVFYVEKSGQLEEAAAEIARAMRTRYVVGYPQPEYLFRVQVMVGGAAGNEKLKAKVVPPAERRK